MAQKLQLLIIHCTATPEGRVVTAQDIRQWHLGPKTNPDKTLTYKGKLYKNREVLPNEFIGGVSIKTLEGRGWRQVGYSDMFLLSGNVINLVPYNDDDTVDPWEITNGVAGINGRSRHVVYAGGTDKVGNSKDTRTQGQRKALLQYIKNIIKLNPGIRIAGHYQFDEHKACPSFNVPLWLELMGVPNENIYWNEQ